MALETMYPGMVNSPEAELTAPIGPSDTTIYIDDVSLLPDAPNYATINPYEENAETVRYTAKGSNYLTVVRAVQGTANTWGSGTKIARVFTEADLDALQTNISESENWYPLLASHKWVYDSSSTDCFSDPGSGKFRASSATLEDVWLICLDALDNNGRDVTAWLDRLYNPYFTYTYEARCYIFARQSSTVFAYWKVADTGSESGFRSIYVDKLQTFGNFTNGLPIEMYFFPVGIQFNDVTPEDLGIATPGVVTYPSRGDHVHAMPALGEISDVTITDVITGAPLIYDGTEWANEQPTPKKNLIINGNFDVWQRGDTFTSATTPANNDDTYLPDRWILLSDGNDVVDVSKSTTNVTAGSTYTLKCEVETANKKFGWLNILNYYDSSKLQGKVVSLSFKAATTTSKVINNLRAAIISWSSTADVPTSDVISAWNASGSDPTLIANWTYENVPVNLALTTTMTTFKIENVTIDTASMANVAIFIWIDDTDAAVDDLLYLSQVKLEMSEYATPFEQEFYVDELEKCKWFFERIPFSTPAMPICAAFSDSTTTVLGQFFFSRKRSIPTISTRSNTDYQWRAATSAGTGTPTSVLFQNIGPFSCNITCAGTWTSGLAGLLRVVAGGTAGYIDISSEL